MCKLKDCFDVKVPRYGGYGSINDGRYGSVNGMVVRYCFDTSVDVSFELRLLAVCVS